MPALASPFPPVPLPGVPDPAKFSEQFIHPFVADAVVSVDDPGSATNIPDTLPDSVIENFATPVRWKAKV